MRTIDYAPDTIIKLPNIFGTGVDGNIVYAVNTTLTGDVLAENITINPGVIVTTNGYRLFARNTFRNLGTVRMNGINAAGRFPGGGTGGTTTIPGMAGAAGRTTIGAGIDAVHNTFGYGGMPMAGGAGGNVGASDGGLPGAPDVDETGRRFYNNIIDAFTHLRASANSGVNVEERMGPMGGGGGGANATGAGTESGGGGGGAGMLMIAAKQIDCSLGILSVVGGNGGNASGAGNAGGGGGGGGGIILLVGLTINGGVELVTGGNGGVKVGTGIAGVPGESGLVYAIPGV